MVVVEKIPETKQDLLDLYVQKSLNGQFPSYGLYLDSRGCERQGCLYRTKDGKACVAGLLIKDEQYDPKMEGSRACYIFNDELKLPNYIIEYDIVNIQYIHDSMALSWNHNRFVEQLLRTKTFKGMQPSPSQPIHSLTGELPS